MIGKCGRVRLNCRWQFPPPAFLPLATYAARGSLFSPVTPALAGAMETPADLRVWVARGPNAVLDRSCDYHISDETATDMCRECQFRHSESS